MLVNLDAVGWFLDEREVLKGNRVKYTALAVDPRVSPDESVQRWVWKTSKPSYPLEFWSEVIAAEIAHVIGIEAPQAHPGIYRGEYGALMRNFVDRDSGEVLDHGGDLLLAVKSDYDRVKGRDHSVQLILRTMQVWGLQVQNYPPLFAQWLFDALIGNQDRHQDNWGLIVAPDETTGVRRVLRLAPAFDNGSSLGRELTEDGVQRLLTDESALDKYVARGQAHVRWDGAEGLVRVTHEGLVIRHIAAYPASRMVAQTVFNFDIERVVAAIHAVCQDSRDSTDMPITPEREDFIERSVRLRNTRLRRLLGLDIS